MIAEDVILLERYILSLVGINKFFLIPRLQFFCYQFDESQCCTTTSLSRDEIVKLSYDRWLPMEVKKENLSGILVW